MKNSIKRLSLVLATALLAGCSPSESPTNAGQAEPELPTGPISSEEGATEPAGAVALEAYDAAMALAPGGNCSLDAINGAATAGASVVAGSEVMFGGWVADASNRVPTVARLILTDGANAYSAPLTAGGVRPDVATALGSEALASSGFNLLVRMDAAPGTYQLSIAHGSGEAAALCGLNASLLVTQ